jgi:hypothetical protein
MESSHHHLTYDLIGRWGCWRRLTDRHASAAADEWRRALGVRQAVRLERVSRSQVTGACGRRGCSLVGVVYDEDSACIYHTRALTGEDLIHELLHVAHPEWPETRVVEETDRMTRLYPQREGNDRASCQAGGCGSPGAHSTVPVVG